MKAILLSRVSTEEQQGALSAQAFRLAEYAAKLAFDPIQTVEFDESAYKLDRRRFNDIVIKPMQASKVPIALVCDKIDRLLRGFGQELITLDGLRSQGRVELHFPSDNIVLHKDSPATDLFRFSMGVSLAKYYSDSIRDNVKRRFEQMARDGKLFTQAPLGYKNVHLPDGTKTVEVDEGLRSPLIQAFQSRSDSLSYEQIAQQLNAAGVRSRRAGRPITMSRVEEILNNPFYCGTLTYKGHRYPHVYESIISKELFEDCQKVRNKRHYKHFKNTSKPFLFKGLVECAYCGYNVVSSTAKGKYTYLKCTQYGGKCGAVRVREEALTAQVGELLNGIHIPRSAAGEVLTMLNDLIAADMTQDALRRKELTSELQSTSRKLSLLYEDRLDGRITTADYDQRAKEYKALHEATQAKLTKTAPEASAKIASAAEVLKLAGMAKELFTSESSKLEHKRGLLDALLSNLSLKGEKLHFNLKAPFDTIAECSKNHEWYRWSDLNRHEVALTGF